MKELYTAGPGQDPMDSFSLPSSATETKLGILFDLPLRTDPNKPGRSLAVTWDLRFPLVDGFRNTYSYLMRFDNVGSLAGNHFHKVKREIFYPVFGSFDVGLLDIVTGECENIVLSGLEPRFLFIRASISHAVVAQTVGACLLVIADAPNTAIDEFPKTVL